MSVLATGQSTNVERSNDTRFTRRVIRLGLVSAVALGFIWRVAADNPGVPHWVGLSLLGGWVTMPTLLGASVFRPEWRTLLVIPSTLVTFGVAGAMLENGHWTLAQQVGWIALSSGILLGDLLGLWFWLRLMPVPSWLEDPFSRPRWAAIGIHVGLVAAGIALVAL